MKFVRKSPERYDHVKSKVARCIKVQNKANFRSKQKKDDNNRSSSTYELLEYQYYEPRRASPSPSYR